MIIKSMKKDQEVRVFAILNRVTRIDLTEKTLQKRLERGKGSQDSPDILKEARVTGGE